MVEPFRAPLQLELAGRSVRTYYLMKQLSLLVLCLAALFGQERIRADVNQAEQPIRVDVNLVNIGFTARDGRGTLATGLTRDDVEVFEDGALQKVSFFARSSDVPLTLGLVMDMSGSQEHFMKPHHRDLEAFLKTVMDPRDRAFLLCFGRRLRLVADFTATPDDLLEGLRVFEKGNRRFPEFAPSEDRSGGTAFYDAIWNAVTERLAKSETGRRALLIFSDGEDNSSAHHMLDAIEAAQSADVRLYGLRYTDVKSGHMNARNKYGMRVLDRLALETGGAHYDASEGELKKWFAEIGEELRATYELAYQSTNPERDGTFRKIVIRPKRSDLKIRAKTGYYARP